MDAILAFGFKLVGKPYGDWDGTLPLSKGAPMWCEDAPVPAIDEINSLSCAGLVNLVFRANGIPLPRSEDGSIGGTYAYGEYYKKVAVPFKILPEYPVGTLIGRYYKNYDDQGHVAFIINDRMILQSCPGNGCTMNVTIDEMHDVYSYDYMVSPAQWQIVKAAL